MDAIGQNSPCVFFFKLQSAGEDGEDWNQLVHVLVSNCLILKTIFHSAVIWQVR